MGKREKKKVSYKYKTPEKIEKHCIIITKTGDRIKESECFSEENKKIALDFRDELLAQNIGLPKVGRYLQETIRLNKQLEGKNFEEVTKKDIKKITPDTPGYIGKLATSVISAIGGAGMFGITGKLCESDFPRPKNTNLEFEEFKKLRSLASSADSHVGEYVDVRIDITSKILS